MPKLSNLYPSKWLTSDDLPEEGIIVTIVSVDIEKMNDGVEKPVIYFSEIAKGLVCNKTNAKSIEKMYGDETDDWVDERISIYPTWVDFKGEQVNAIRVKPKKPVPSVKMAAPAKAAGNGKGKKPAVMTQAEVDQAAEEVDDSPPF